MPRRRAANPRLAIAAAAAGMIVGALTGCGRPLYDPDRATRGYPSELHTTNTVDIQVFREGEHLELVNSTPVSYTDFDLWINQRYLRHVKALPAGETIRLSLWDFYDELGEVVIAGGFWRTEQPTPVRLVEIQTGETETLIGLIAIRTDYADPTR